jgi:nucleotide-binding universal stress UspA family protein
MFERILVPLDGSEAGEAVFQPLRQMFRRKDAEVILVQAIDLPNLASMNHSATILIGMENEAAEYLERVRARLEGEGLRVRSLVLQGSAVSSILKAADSERATLIAIATHGRSGFVRWMLGSVTEEILRHSPVPVLVWRSNKSTAPGAGDGVGTILVPFDGSGESLGIAPCVIETARLFGAGVAVVKVEEAAPGGVDVGFVGHLLDGPMDLKHAPDILDRDLLVGVLTTMDILRWVGRAYRSRRRVRKARRVG